jgi:hypothetical protein
MRKLDVPGVVGVPLILLPFKDKPAGKLPWIMAKL